MYLAFILILLNFEFFSTFTHICHFINFIGFMICIFFLFFMLGPILLFFALFFSFPYKFLLLSFVFILVLNFTLHYYTYDLYCIPESHKSWSVSMKMNTNCVKLILHYNTRQQCGQDWALAICHKMAELWVNVNLVKLI